MKQIASHIILFTVCVLVSITLQAQNKANKRVRQIESGRNQHNDTATYLDRELIVFKVFQVKNDTVELYFYDDRDIDNDTVSVYYNRELILDHERLSNKPIRRVVAVDSTKNSELLFYANNLGSVPPNTALLIIVDNKVRKAVLIHSDTEQSGTILLRRKPLIEPVPLPKRKKIF